MSLTFVLGLLVASHAAPAFGPQQRADLGACTLQSGERIEPCIVGYRTFGTLAPERDNVVVLVTWFTGTSGSFRNFFGPTRLLQLYDKYVIIIDALGDGISSSPSNSPTQPGVHFPSFTVGDMVRSQHRLLTEILGFDHVQALFGISMGGMQVLDWVVRYPDFMDQAVSVVGTPRPTERDRRPWRAEVAAMRDAIGVTGSGMPDLQPQPDARPPPRDAEDLIHFNTMDRMYHFNAMLAHDVAPGVAMRDLGASVHARLLFILSSRDQLLQPGPSLDMAAATAAEVLLLHGPCGHLAPVMCETAAARAAIRRFLAAARP